MVKGGFPEDLSSIPWTNSQNFLEFQLQETW